MTLEKFAERMASELPETYLPFVPSESILLRKEVVGEKNRYRLAIRLPEMQSGKKTELFFDLNRMYQAVRNMPEEQAMYTAGELIRQALKHTNMQEIQSMEALASDYESVKPHLCVRVCAVPQEGFSLDNAMYKRMKGVEDLALLPCIDIKNYGTPMIGKGSLKKWGISAEQLLWDALVIGEQKYPAAIYTLDSLLGEAYGMDTLPPKKDLMILTNLEKRYGAAALFYPGVLKKLGDTYGDLLILPSSIHEMLVLPAEEIPWTQYRELEQLITDTNLQLVAPEERLTNHAYHYDSGKDRLEPLKVNRRREKSIDINFASHMEKKPPLSGTGGFVV